MNNVYMHPSRLLAGSFVETAFTAQQVDRALAIEREHGMDCDECAFMYSSPASVDQQLPGYKSVPTA